MCMFQVVKSDTDCEGSSESENQRENAAQTAQKKTAHTPRPDVIVEDQCSDQDELIRRVQNTTLTETGTMMMCDYSSYFRSQLIWELCYQVIMIRLMYNIGH